MSSSTNPCSQSLPDCLRCSDLLDSYRLDTHLDASHTLNQTSMCRNCDDTSSFASIHVRPGPRAGGVLEPASARLRVLMRAFFARWGPG